MSVNSIRRAGLCADHFNISSFKEDKKKLKRDAVPIPFTDSNNLQKTTIRIQTTENIYQGEKKEENQNIYNSTTAGTSLESSEQLEIDQQLFQEFPLRTYPPP